jgi:prolyl oligopeptidase
VTQAPLAPVLVLAAATALAAPPPEPAGPPAAAKRAIVDTYWRTPVTDEYRWLEDWSDPQVKAWSEAQNAWARRHLDGLPGVAALREEVTRLRSIAIPRYYALAAAGPSLFALVFEPPKQQSWLVVMASEDDPSAPRVLVDPNRLDPSGGTSIDWYVPSPDGSKVAVSLSEGGSERGNARVFETASGREVGEVVPRVNYGTALGSLAWDADGSGFYYTRYPREGERPPADMDFYVQVYHHRIGTPTAGDRYEIAREFPRIAEIDLDRSPDGAWILANVQNGDGGEFVQYLRGRDGRWTQLTQYRDRVIDAVFGHDGWLYLLSRAGAPRGKVLRLPLPANGAPSLEHASLLIAEGDGVVKYGFFGPDGIVPTPERLFVVEGVGGPNRVRMFDLAGRELGALPVPPVSSVSQVVALPGRGRDAVLFRSASYLEPTAWYRWEAKAGGAAAVKTGLTRPWPVDFGDCEAVREFAVSRDGTRVPINIIRRKGTRLDGSNPTLLTGYGGYGVSQVPRFDPGLRVWLDRGGVWAEANLRGGGEFGEDWHRAGALTRKQNVFDDFLACTRHLIAAGYTSPQRLAIEGGSNGGLLMGAALTQAPELFRAVVSHVGEYDMLRVELSPNGAFNVPEFGTVKDEAQFRALYAYSPYRRVNDGTAYPAVLMLTGANDPRVDPMHSRKMTARLQAANPSGRPVLLRTSGSTGHGGGTPLAESIAQEVDVWAFLCNELGVPATPVPAKSASR